MVPDAHFTGIDTSAVALNRFGQLLSAEPVLAQRVRIVERDIFGVVRSGMCDAVILPDCTLNGFNDEASLAALLDRVAAVSRTRARLALSMFDDRAPEALAHPDGRLVADSFVDD